jgi:hypothetical protein
MYCRVLAKITFFIPSRRSDHFQACIGRNRTKAAGKYHADDIYIYIYNTCTLVCNAKVS